jgi:hypothetical protein
VDLKTICLVHGHPDYINIFLQAHTQMEGLKCSFCLAVPKFRKLTVDINYCNIIRKVSKSLIKGIWHCVYKPTPNFLCASYSEKSFCFVIKFINIADFVGFEVLPALTDSFCLVGYNAV